MAQSFGHTASATVLDPCFTPLPGAHIPQVVHSLRCSFLIDKHILPVHHRKGIKNGAQGLDGCGNNRGSGHPFSRSPPPPALSYPSHTPRDPHAGPHFQARMDSNHGSPYNVTGEMARDKLHCGGEVPSGCTALISSVIWGEGRQ